MTENNSTAKINEIMTAALDKIRSLADAQTIIGQPIPTPGGTTIIPVSKVFVGFASGGVDYAGKHTAPQNAAKPNANNFGGGGGTGLTVSPVAFLVVDPSGDVQLLNVNEPTKQANDPVSQVIGLLERSPELIEKLKVLFAKKESDAASENNAQ